MEDIRQAQVRYRIEGKIRCFCAKKKKLKIKIYRNIILPVVCMGVKLGR